MAPSVFPKTEKKCPYCLEPISQDAMNCPHCGSLIDNGSAGAKGERSDQEPSLFQVLLANLFCPGLGSWRLGEKARGGVILLVMILCIIMTGANYASMISRQLEAAGDTQDDTALETSFSSSAGTWWATISTLVFIYSFVDIFLIHLARKKKKNPF